MKPATSTYRLFKIDTSTKENIDSFVEFIKEKYPFKDEYQTSLPLTIKKHYHVGPEARLFLSGVSYFVLGDGTELICDAGTYLEIDPGLVHSFYSPLPFKAIRFNTMYEDWRAIDVD